MNVQQNRVLALSGIFQATELVARVAKQGQCSEPELTTTINSLFITDPDQTLDVYGSISQLKLGLTTLTQQFSQREARQPLDSIRYALSIMHLSAKLRKHPKMLDQISEGLARAQNAKTHFGLLHDNTFASLASTYQSTISTLGLQIQVSGEARFLQMEHNAAKIRALLLAAVRSAMLWHQLGGHRWHFIFKRQALVHDGKALLAQC